VGTYLCQHLIEGLLHFWQLPLCQRHQLLAQLHAQGINTEPLPDGHDVSGTKECIALEELALLSSCFLLADVVVDVFL
jgi:hypothetical protein